jgi:hypothetical protein
VMTKYINMILVLTFQMHTLIQMEIRYGHSHMLLMQLLWWQAVNLVGLQSLILLIERSQPFKKHFNPGMCIYIRSEFQIIVILWLLHMLTVLF